MTKAEFIERVRELYRVGNRSDSDSPERESWTVSEMAGDACCRPLDNMLEAMKVAGVLTERELQVIYDTL